jgi:predicted dehydrogenase
VEIRTIGVGMLGYAFMGKAHSNAYRKIAYMTWPPPLVPRLVAVAGRTEAPGSPLHSGPGERAQGFRTVLVSEADHPFWEHWWPHGHIIGWERTFVHELHHLLSAIAGDGPVAPHGATFEDGYRCA